MSVDARVSRPAAGADRVRPARVLAAALGGLACGLATVWLVAKDPAAAAGALGSDRDGARAGAPTRVAGAAPGERAAALAPPDDHDASTDPLGTDDTRERADGGALAVGAGSLGAPTTAAIARDAGTRADVDRAADAPAGTRATRRSLELGTVAYLRCDGLELGGGRFPCPRDRALEDTGWQVLETLGACAENPGVGTFEVRVELARHDVADVRYRRIDDAAVDLAVVDRCLGPALRALRTELAPERMIVSFRLVLR